MATRKKLFVKSDDSKETYIQFRVGELEKSLLNERADAAGLSLSQYLINSGLRRQIRSQAAVHVIEELRLLSMQIKQLAPGNEIDSELCRETLIAIKRLMLAIWNKEIRL